MVIFNFKSVEWTYLVTGIGILIFIVAPLICIIFLVRIHESREENYHIDNDAVVEDSDIVPVTALRALPVINLSQSRS